MERKSRHVVLLALVTIALGQARAQTPILPLDQIRPGMKGVGRTVFSGTAIESFDCSVIGVLKSFDFQMDMILIRIESGPVVTKQYGIVAGMSGSPIYIDGKLIGALAYGWPFQIEAIAGVTPIEQMLEHHDPSHPLVQSARERRTQTAGLAGGLRSVTGPIAFGGRAVEQVQVAPNLQEAATLSRARPDLAVMTPVATPLLVSGLGGSGLRDLRDFLEPYNLVPMQAGAAGAPPPPDAPFELAPGAAVGVPIAAGDIELSAIGTLTYLDGDTALAFGHPFFGFGGVELPFHAAYVTTVISSQSDSNKMGGLLHPLGTLTQDRPTCVGAKLGPAPATIPVEYTLRETDRGNTRTFRVQMARQPQITTTFAVSMLNMAMENVAGGEYDGVVDSRVEITARPTAGGEPVQIIRENAFSASGSATFGQNPMLDLFTALTMLQENPFGKATVDAVKVELQFTKERKPLTLQRAQATRLKVKPGETLDVICELKPFGGEITRLTVPIKVPDNIPLGPLAVALIGGGDSFALRPRLNPAPTPTDVSGLLGWLNNQGRSDAIYAELLQASNGLEFEGRRLGDLPDPVAEVLLTTSGDSLQAVRDITEQVHPTDQPTAGVAVVTVDVVGPEGETADEEGQDFESPGIEAPGQRLGGPPMMMEMGLSTPLAGLARMPHLERVLRREEPALAASLARHLERLEWATARVERTRLARFERLRRGTTMPPLRWSPRAEAPAEAPAEAAPGEAEAPATPEAPPDITGDLNLDDPPAMPTWRELRAVERGDLQVGEAATGEPTEATEDGEALARPPAVWTLDDAEAFGGGRFTNTYLANRGRVAMAPLMSIAGRPETDRAWAVLPRPDGAVLVGGWGEEATVHRIAGDGGMTELLRADDAGVTALVALGDDLVLAATAPSGTIYRLSGGTATKAAQLPEPYIWAMVPDGQGGVYAATGYHGRLYQVSGDGQAKVLFQARDRHLLALCVDPTGGVLAGAYPSGRVYRVDGAGVATSVFQAEDAGVLSLAATAEHLYVGTAGTGQVYRLDRDGNQKELLEGESGNIYGLVAQGDWVYASAGQPGRILRFNGDDEQAQLYASEEPMLLGLAAAPDRLVASVAVSGDVLRLAMAGGDRGVYVSPVHDAGVMARWGVLRWDITTTNHATVAVETRSGNSTTPDAAWSPWSPGSVERGGVAVSSPPGRYIQFRATFYGQPGDTCALDGVNLFYRTVNRAPTLTVKAPEAGSLVREEVELEWEAEDPDDDKLTYQVFYAPPESDAWTEIKPADKDAEETGDEPAEGETAAEEPADEAPADEAPADGPEPGAAPAAGTTLADRLGEAWAGLRQAVARYAPLRAAQPAQPGLALIAEGEAANEAEPDAEEPAGDEEADKPAGPLEETSLTWDTSAVPDGVYRLKIVASDARRNPDDPRETSVLTGLIRVDNTAPVADPAPPEGQVLPPLTEVTVKDAGSWLASAEYKLDDGEWSALLPVDGIFDSPTESLKLPAIDTADGAVVLYLRVRDAAGNVGRMQWEFDAGAAPPAG